MRLDWLAVLLVAAPALAAPSQLAAGDHHVCAVADGQVRCWGANDHGQLGDGTRRQRLSPASALGISGAVAIAALGDSSCAVDKRGVVTCWGLAPNGARSAEDPYAPKAVAGVQGAVSVALADVGIRACAIVKAGAVVCWSRRAAPSAIGAVSGAVELALTPGGGCARSANGKLACWTWAESGPTTARPIAIDDALAIAPTSERKYVVALRRGGRASRFDVKEPDKLTTVDHIDAAQLGGGAGEIGVTAAGKLTRVFDSHEPPNPQLPPPRLTLPPLDGVITVAAATEIFWERRYGCAIVKSGALLCWGDNVAGVLGDGQADHYDEPQPVPKLAQIAQIAVGEQHACARRANGGVTCWGRESGGWMTASPLSRLSPVDVQGVDDAVDISVRMTTSCAVRRSGRVVCWGDAEEHPTVARRPPAPLGDLADALQITGDAYYACVVRRTGAVACFQSGWHDVAGLSNAVEVRSRNLYHCARTQSGDVFCWERGTPPKRIEGVGEAVQLAVTDTIGCARKKSGEVICWFLSPPTNAEGEPQPPRLIAAHAADVSGGEAILVTLADGAVFAWLEVRPRGLVRLTASDAVAAAAISRSGCALRRDRTVACWGDNHDGQLGIGVGKHRDEPRPVTFSAAAVPSSCADGMIAACARGTTLEAKQIACAADSASACEDVARRYAEGDGLPLSPLMASWIWGDLCVESDRLDDCRAMAKHGDLEGAVNVLGLACARGNTAACSVNLMPETQN